MLVAYIFGTPLLYIYPINCTNTILPNKNIELLKLNKHMDINKFWINQIIQEFEETNLNIALPIYNFYMEN